MEEYDDIDSFKPASAEDVNNIYEVIKEINEKVGQIYIAAWISAAGVIYLVFK